MAGVRHYTTNTNKPRVAATTGAMVNPFRRRIDAMRVAECRSGVKSGDRFGSRVVLGCPFSLGGKRWAVVVQCDCGSVEMSRVTHLARGEADRCCSCRNRTRTPKHGDARKRSETRLYRVWKGIKVRCFDSHDPNYRRYGARGI